MAEYSKKLDQASAGQIGIKAFVLKPINKSALAGIVRKILDDR